MTILADPDTQRKPTFIRADENLILLLENLVCLIERMWRTEMKAEAPSTRRQAVLRKAHQALGEWVEFEDLGREACR